VLISFSCCDSMWLLTWRRFSSLLDPFCMSVNFCNYSTGRTRRVFWQLKWQNCSPILSYCLKWWSCTTVAQYSRSIGIVLCACLGSCARKCSTFLICSAFLSHQSDNDLKIVSCLAKSISAWRSQPPFRAKLTRLVETEVTIGSRP
jgi:hypothetical protein